MRRLPLNRPLSRLYGATPTSPVICRGVVESTQFRQFAQQRVDQPLANTGHAEKEVSLLMPGSFFFHAPGQFLSILAISLLD
jgi:hypothetical protein